jgi:glycosyltransferase involved in cell wall biosynthesis
MNKKEIIVSIIIPTHNRGIKIIETINAIEENEFPNEKLEIIIIDDFSEKNPKKIIENLNKKYKNILFIRNSKNLGPSATRNKGVKKSRGEFVFFTDDDCIPPKNWISEYLNFLRLNKQIALVGGCAEPSSKNIIAQIENIKDKILGVRVKNPKVGGKEIHTGFTGNVAYRKKVFIEFGGFEERLKRQEDVELKNRVAQKYLVATHPLLVIHNHQFNLDYLLSRVIKEGLEKLPPKNRKEKMILITSNIPFLIYNIIKKIILYRK